MSYHNLNFNPSKLSYNILSNVIRFRWPKAYQCVTDFLYSFNIMITKIAMKFPIRPTAQIKIDRITLARSTSWSSTSSSSAHKQQFLIDFKLACLSAKHDLEQGWAMGIGQPLAHELVSLAREPGHGTSQRKNNSRRLTDQHMALWFFL